MSRRINRENGVALVVALMAMLLMMALGVALVMATRSETMIAGNYRDAQACAYAADAALERAIADLRVSADWSEFPGGGGRSGFVDGAPDGRRMLPGGDSVDLTALTDLANCSKAAACSAADMDRATADRPWGANNPRWRLYAHGRLADLLPAGAIDSPYYLVVFVGDDQSENDGDPSVDGTAPANPGAGVLALRAEAFGPRGLHSRVDATVARSGGVGIGIRVLSWREIR